MLLGKQLPGEQLPGEEVKCAIVMAIRGNENCYGVEGPGVRGAEIGVF